MQARFILGICLVSLFVACSRIDDGDLESRTVSGKVAYGVKKNQIAAGILDTQSSTSFPVKIYELKSDGTQGNLVCDTQTDGDGDFDCDINDDTGAFVVNATVGSGSSLRAVVSRRADTYQVSVNAITEFVSSRAIKLLQLGVIMDGAVAVANTEMKAALGLNMDQDVAEVQPAAQPSTDSSKNENTLGAQLLAVETVMADVGTSMENSIAVLATQFQEGKFDDGTWQQVGDTFNTIVASDSAYDGNVNTVVFVSDPPKVLSDFSLLSESQQDSTISLTWSESLAAYYDLKVCPDLDLNSPSCQNFQVTGALNLDLPALAPGDYLVTLQADGTLFATAASNDSPLVVHVSPSAN